MSTSAKANRSSTSGETAEPPVAELPAWLRDARRQRLLFGDWNRVIRDPIDVLRVLLLVGSALLLALDMHLEAAPLATVLIVLVPRLLDMPRPFDFAVVLGMSLQAWGNLFDFFDRFAWYDDVVHFLLPMLTCSGTYILLVRLGVVPEFTSRAVNRRHLGIFLVTFLIGLGYAALYEIYEAGADWVLGTDPPLQDSLADTNTDLLFGALGSAVGALLLVAWTQRGWTMTRRVPGEALMSVIAATRRAREVNERPDTRPGAYTGARHGRRRDADATNKPRSRHREGDTEMRTRTDTVAVLETGVNPGPTSVTSTSTTSTKASSAEPAARASMSILVHAEVHGLAGRAGELRELLADHAQLGTRAPGNLGSVTYEPVGAAAGEFVIDMWWQDEAALRAHYGSGEYGRYAARVGELLARPSDVQIHYVDRTVSATGDPSIDPSRQG